MFSFLIHRLISDVISLFPIYYCGSSQNYNNNLLASLSAASVALLQFNNWAVKTSFVNMNPNRPLSG